MPRLSSVPRVGFVGAGQLARMTIQAAIPLAVPIHLLADRPDDGAAIVSPHVSLGSAKDADALARFAAEVDIVTFDHELVNADALAKLEAAGHAIRPTAATMAMVQDKLSQRRTLADGGFPIPTFRPIEREADLLDFGAEHGWPFIAKATKGGYDGRGVWVVASPDDAQALYREATERGTRLLAERMVRIEQEVAIQVARRPSGEAVAYPVVETVQVDGICRELIAPARITPELAREAERIALGLAERIGLIGLLAVELFVECDPATGEQHILVNELAARPHNSAHWTIEGCRTSQFEQHLRAVLDWPLGDTTPVAPCTVTVNVLGAANASGDPATRLPIALEDREIHAHLYGKTARPGRKLGHVTILGKDPETLLPRARRAAAILSGEADIDGAAAE